MSLIGLGFWLPIWRRDPIFAEGRISSKLIEEAFSFWSAWEKKVVGSALEIVKDATSAFLAGHVLRHMPFDSVFILDTHKVSFTKGPSLDLWNLDMSSFYFSYPGRFLNAFWCWVRVHRPQETNSLQLFSFGICKTLHMAFNGAKWAVCIEYIRIQQTIDNRREMIWMSRKI